MVVGTAYDGNMLKPIYRLSAELQAKCREKEWIAHDPKTGSYLKRGFGSQKPGKRRIYLYNNLKMTLVVWALTDREAIAEVNRKYY